MAFEKAYALTGGIASGKSTVGEIFRGYGVKIIDADRIAHEVLDQQSGAIAASFGEAYVSNQGKVNRQALGALVFSDAEAKKSLEMLLHPLIYEEIQRQSEVLDREGKPYLVDIPLFFETQRYPIDHSIVVYAPRAIQLERLMQRNGLNRREAAQRIDAQMDIEKKKKLATYLIDNQGDLHALQSQCDKIYSLLLLS